jgi:hypothetical protein
MLSRLLSVAAAATAATLMGDDHQALSEARGLTGGTGIGDMGGNGEDGSFDGFLRALQNGRIASALRQGGDGQENGEGGQSGPLNFFRMFRFGTPGANGASEHAQTDPQTGEQSNTGDNRMVPIIIVGIRSISPNSGSGAGAGVDDLPPFIDALGHFPSPLPAHALGTHGQDSIDSILSPPQNGTSFRHRRRASMGGLGMGRSRINDRYDDQRDHRSPDRRRERPWSVASSNSNTEPRPPPATPASPSPELSRISSRNSTPSHSRPASFVANSIRDFASDSRRNSALQRVAASPLASHTEETGSLHSTRSSDNLLSQARDSDHLRGHRRSDTAPNIHYPRFASGHPRRNGVVEPDNIPSLSRSSSGNGTDGHSSANPEDRNSDSRSWIIYVLGGSYPENHPILTTPSLFTENPTYEDMMLLSTLLGPAKAPVATEDDVQSAGGLYELVVAEPVEDNGTTTIAPASSDRLMAIVNAETKGENDPDRVYLEAGHRCLVCLCDFEAKDTARRLAKCGHLFHKECIDHVSSIDMFESLTIADQISSGLPKVETPAHFVAARALTKRKRPLLRKTRASKASRNPHYKQHQRLQLFESSTSRSLPDRSGDVSQSLHSGSDELHILSLVTDLISAFCTCNWKPTRLGLGQTRRTELGDTVLGLSIFGFSERGFCLARHTSSLGRQGMNSRFSFCRPFFISDSDGSADIAWLSVVV